MFSVRVYCKSFKYLSIRGCEGINDAENILQFKILLYFDLKFKKKKVEKCIYC